MTTRTSLGLVAGAALIAAVSAPALATSEPDLETPIAVDLIEGVPWNLLRQEVDGAMAELPAGVVVTLLMEDGSAGGNGGCNDYFGTYERAGDALTFGEIGATQMYCPETSEVEAAYLANLAAVTRGFSTGGTLLMSGSDGEPIVEFGVAGTEPVPTDAVEGITWQLDALVQPGTDELAPVPQDVAAWIELTDGRASGDGGCNGYSAAYALDGSTLSFSAALSTKMACPDPAREVENTFFGQLDAVAGWYSDGGSLTLIDSDGHVLMVFAPVFEG